MKRWGAGVFCMVLAVSAWAYGGSVRQQAEASMLVTGWIDVSPDGSVHDYTVDRPTLVPDAVIGLIHNNVPNWKFHFDQPVNAMQRARMNLRIIAKTIDDHHDSIMITGATFGEPDPHATDHVTYKNRPAPRYPQAAIEARVDGTVFLMLRVDRLGQVEDVAVEQVNLREYGNEPQMKHFRSILGYAALDAARTWTFTTPTTGAHQMDEHLDIRVPVSFDLRPAGQSPEDTYGKWEPYIPGPHEFIPWQQHGLQPVSDAIPAGSITGVDQPLHLMTALGGA